MTPQQRAQDKAREILPCRCSYKDDEHKSERCPAHYRETVSEALTLAYSEIDAKEKELAEERQKIGEWVDLAAMAQGNARAERQRADALREALEHAKSVIKMHYNDEDPTLTWEQLVAEYPLTLGPIDKALAAPGRDEKENGRE